MKSVIIQDETHARLKRVAKIKGTGISSITEKILNAYADKIEYNQEAFEKFIEDSPKLKTYNEMLLREFHEAPFSVYRDIIKLKEGCSGDIEFNSLIMPESAANLKQMFNKNLEKVFVIIESPQDKIEKAREEVIKITKLIESFSDEGDKNEKVIDVGVILKKNDTLKEGTNRLLIFACYKKEDIKKDKDEKTK